MTAQIAHLQGDEELMDSETFVELYSARIPTGAKGARAAAKVPAEAQRVPDIAELGARPVPRRPPFRPPAPRIGGAGRGGPSGPAAAAALEGELVRCQSSEFVARLGVHLARAYASAAALLLVHRGMIEGLYAEGLAGRGEGLMIPSDRPSLFARVARSGLPFRGAPPENALDARILRALGRPHVQEIVVLPVAIRGRVVNLLYADNGPEALGDTSAAALEAVCSRLGDAYERLILERKVSG